MKGTEVGIALLFATGNQPSKAWAGAVTVTRPD